MLDFFATLFSSWSTKEDGVPAPLRVGMNLFLLVMLGLVIAIAIVSWR